MPDVNLILPKMGESVFEATIIKWLKKEGDLVEADESVLEIATDKVDSEIPSPASGILTKKLFKEGDVVKVGTVIATIRVEAGAEVTPAGGSGVADFNVAGDEPQPAGKIHSANGEHSSESVLVASTVTETFVPPRVSPGGKFFSPLVRNIARMENISLRELESIPGSGANSRLTKNDLLAYLEKRKSGVSVQEKPATVSAPVPEAPPVYANEPVPVPPQTIPVAKGDEIIEMDRMRKLIADHMVLSKKTSPHVTSFVEADVTSMVMWREKTKGDFEKRTGEKLTFTPLFVEAIIRAIKDFPMINSSVDGTRMIIKKNINIGMATALPSGNLIVPVIRNADYLNLFGLVSRVNDLAGRARSSKLLPDEIQDGTFTLTNLGTFGSVMGTPIISQPQAAILATGTIKKKPAVIETPQGDTIGIRHMMFLSLSYDHRIIDGALGGSFVKRVADYLEKFDVTRKI